MHSETVVRSHYLCYSLFFSLIELSSYNRLCKFFVLLSFRFYAANGSEKLEKCWDSSRGAINNGQRFKLLSRGQNDECASQHPTFRTCDNALMTGNGMTASFVNNRWWDMMACLRWLKSPEFQYTVVEQFVWSFLFISSTCHDYHRQSQPLRQSNLENKNKRKRTITSHAYSEKFIMWLLIERTRDCVCIYPWQIEIKCFLLNLRFFKTV